MAIIRKHFTVSQKLEYAKLMVHEGYSNKEVEKISGASNSAVSRWKIQYEKELAGEVPERAALTHDAQRIQELEALLARAQRDNEILKKAAAFFIRDNPKLK